MSKIYLPIFMFLLSGPLAAQSLERGFYVGGMAGVTEFDDDGIFNGLSFDDSDTGFAIFGGYKIQKHLALELRLSDLGSYSVSDGFSSESFDLTAISAHVVGIIPFSDSGWELFGQLGIGSITADFDCCGDEDQTVGSAGLGVRYYPKPNLGISLQIDAYAYEEDGFGQSYDVSVGTTQLGISYLFE